MPYKAGDPSRLPDPVVKVPADLRNFMVGVGDDEDPFSGLNPEGLVNCDLCGPGQGLVWNRLWKKHGLRVSEGPGFDNRGKWFIIEKK